MGKWKAVKSNLHNDRNAAWELFDLETDRNETTDLSSSHPELLKQFDEIVQKEHQSAHIREWEFINPKFKREIAN
jgi:hypothetical protein